MAKYWCNEAGVPLFAEGDYKFVPGLTLKEIEAAPVEETIKPVVRKKPAQEKSESK